MPALESPGAETSGEDPNQPPPPSNDEVGEHSSAEESTQGTIEFGIGPSGRRTVSFCGHSLDLSPDEIRILEIIATRPNHMVGSATLLHILNNAQGSTIRTGAFYKQLNSLAQAFEEIGAGIFWVNERTNGEEGAPVRRIGVRGCTFDMEVLDKAAAEPLSIPAPQPADSKRPAPARAYPSGEWSVGSLRVTSHEGGIYLYFNDEQIAPYGPGAAQVLGVILQQSERTIAYDDLLHAMQLYRGNKYNDAWLDQTLYILEGMISDLGLPIRLLLADEVQKTISIIETASVPRS